MSATEIEASPLELTPLEERVRRGIIQLLEVDEAAAQHEIYMDGLSAFFGQPEFAATLAADRLRAMMEVLESKSALQALLTKTRSMDELQVFIGSENAQEELQNILLSCPTVFRRGLGP
jgi:transcriptional regulator of heat shock response